MSLSGTRSYHPLMTTASQREFSDTIHTETITITISELTLGVFSYCHTLMLLIVNKIQCLLSDRIQLGYHFSAITITMSDFTLAHLKLFLFTVAIYSQQMSNIFQTVIHVPVIHKNR